MHAIRMLLLAVAVLIASAWAYSIPAADQFPFSPKSYSCFAPNTTGELSGSYCLKGLTALGATGQTCFPWRFWVGVCSARVLDADHLLMEALQEEEHDKAIDNTDWHQACFMYDDTWPICVSKKQRKQYCTLWQQLPASEKRVIRALAKKEAL
ncbi:hypothetical protein [Duck adenovirus 1]|nr:hypothetical protein [Duck adenovirus 1]